MNNLPNSALIKYQKMQREYKAVKTEEHGKVDIIVEIRYDDQCGNGHNSFSLTGDIYGHGKLRIDRNMICCGAIGDTIAKYIPELAHLNKWHLTSSDGPMHYIANILYWAQAVEPNLEFVRASAVWPDATLEELQNKEKLLARLPALMLEFKRDIESLGFTY